MPMKKNIIVTIGTAALMASAFLSSEICAEGINGDWSGSLELGANMKMKLVFHISDTEITMDSPDQGAFGITGETLFLSQDSVAFSVPQISMTYSGHLKDGKIDGTFKQGYLSLPLLLSPGVEKPNRPQAPQAPFPYSTEEVRIENPTGGSVLAGTLVIPENANVNTPVVVMVTGSGLQNRDEELFGHRPFVVIADGLARNGIASLRYDDRGAGESTGDATSATTLDFASDAKAVMDWAKATGRFGKTGILGHSEGGIIAYMLASGEDTPDFIVSVGGPSVKGSRILAFQNKNALLKAGLTDEAHAADFEAAVEKALSHDSTNNGNELDEETLISTIYPSHDNDAITRQLTEALRAILRQENTNPWFSFFNSYDPAEAIAGIKTPTFIIYGEKDMQVPAALNLEPAKNLAPKAKIKVYPGLNHLMQHAEAGDISEYATIEETFAPEVLEDIVTFIYSL